MDPEQEEDLGWGDRLEMARSRRLLSREALSSLAVTVSPNTIYRMEQMRAFHGRPRSIVAILAGLHAALPLTDEELATLAPGIPEVQIRRALARQNILAQAAPVTKAQPESGPGSLPFLADRLSNACGRPLATQIMHALIAAFEGVALSPQDATPHHTRPPPIAARAPAPPPTPATDVHAPLPSPPPGSVRITPEPGVTVYEPVHANRATPIRPSAEPAPATKPPPERRRGRRKSG